MSCHDHTPEDLAALGILDRSPVPLRFVFDVKRSGTGQFQKYKARIVLCGHRGFMIKGVHYTDTFAAAPDVTASRTLQAIACGLKWERLCYDISTAYLQAKAELGDQIPLIYPAGMQSYDYRSRGASAGHHAGDQGEDDGRHDGLLRRGGAAAKDEQGRW
jgi:hypothetical protein